MSIQKKIRSYPELSTLLQTTFPLFVPGVVKSVSHTPGSKTPASRPAMKDNESSEYRAERDVTSVLNLVSSKLLKDPKVKATVISMNPDDNPNKERYEKFAQQAELRRSATDKTGNLAAEVSEKQRTSFHAQETDKLNIRDGIFGAVSRDKNEIAKSPLGEAYLEILQIADKDYQGYQKWRKVLNDEEQSGVRNHHAHAEFPSTSNAYRFRKLLRKIRESQGKDLCSIDCNQCVV